MLFCAPVIPGQEGQHARLMATLKNKGIKVMTRADAPLYSQAHARLPELLELAKLADPKTILPVHGDQKLRTACADAMGKAGHKTLSADNGDAIHISRDGCRSAEPETKGAPRLVGFKTLQGSTWSERHYLMKTAPQPKLPNQPQDAANSNRRRPKIFNINPK